jgi:hypothetical protein
MTLPAAPTHDRGRRTLAAALRRPTRPTLVMLAILGLIVGVGIYFHLNSSPRWHRVQSLSVALAVAVYVAVLVRNRWRDAALIVASLVFCLVATEAYITVAYQPPLIDVTASFTVARPILGWGPKAPGAYHHIKQQTATGRVVFDVDYTIDTELHRQVVSAADGPTVAFVGGSDTFGLGLPDPATLPQLFADVTGRSVHVVNFAYPGYGPQQFLRALETGLFDGLQQPRLFVIPTDPWLVDRTSCVNSETERGPRYELIGGQPIFQGTCAEGEPLVLRLLERVSSIYPAIIAPALQGATLEKIDLFVAILVRAGQLARDKYGATTLVIYEPNEPYLRPLGYTDEQLMQRLRDGGLVVVDGALDPAAYPGQDLAIPGEGHPTAVANRAWAMLVQRYVEEKSLLRR